MSAKNIKDSINKTFERFNSYYSDGDFVIGFITDVHTGGNKHYKHYKYFFDTAKQFHMNLLINGGDIGLGLGEDMKVTDKIIKQTVKYSKTDLPLLFVKGNHDCGTQNISDNYLYNSLMNDSLKKHSDKITLVNDCAYGTYKDDQNKLLVIYLNTSDIKCQSYHLSNSQIEWLINTLSNVEKGYRIVIVSHMCMDKIGMWNSTAQSTNFTLEESVTITQNIIHDFVEHKAGKVTTKEGQLSWNFKKKDNCILFELAGDSHFDNFINRDGLNVVVRQGYGGIKKEEIFEGGSHIAFSGNEGFDKVTDCLFDVICIKPNNDSKIFRIGVGDKELDIDLKIK